MIYNGEASSLVASSYEVAQAEQALLAAGREDFGIHDIESEIIAARDEVPA
jgi:hypothetical protein